MRYSYLLALVPLLASAVPPSEPGPTNPLQLWEGTCNDLAASKGHADIEEYYQAASAERLCTRTWKAKDLGPGEALHSRISHLGVNYDYKVSWVEGCTTTVERQSVNYPLDTEEWSCYRLWYTVYKGCMRIIGIANDCMLMFAGYNGGIGGWMNVGCLQYRFNGGLGPENWDGP